MCDSRYCFTFVDIGNYGRDNDAHILNNSLVGKAFLNGTLDLPPLRNIDGYLLPYVVVSDEIFG